MLMRKGGWQGGSKMQNLQEIRGSKWSNAVSLERILVGIVRVWARLSSFSSNPCSKAVQNDHIRSPHPHAAAAARSAGDQRKDAALEGELEVVVATVDDLASHQGLGDVRGVLERVAVVEHEVRDLPLLDGAVVLVDAEELRRVDGDGPQRGA